MNTLAEYCALKQGYARLVEITDNWTREAGLEEIKMAVISPTGMPYAVYAEDTRD